MDGDETLMRRAEAVLSELDRDQGLSDEHADVLAALRIRLDGAPRRSLDDILRAAGDLRGKRSLDDPIAAAPRRSLDDVLKKTSAPKEWPGL